MACGAQAVNIGWDSGGGTDTEWSNPENWAMTYVPGNSNEVDRADLFSGSDDVTVTSDVTSPNQVDLLLRNNGNMTISANMSSLRVMNIGINGGTAGLGTFVKQTAGTVNASDVLLGTDDTNGGLYELSGSGALVLTGDTTIGANGKFSMIGNDASFNAGNDAGDDFTMLTTGVLDFKLDASGIGTITVADTFSIDGTSSLLTLDLSAFSGTGSFDLVSFSSIAGTFDVGNISGLDSLTGGRSASITYDADSMNLTVIPEPATLGLVSAFGGGLLFIRRLLQI
jgi:hypothetical protein